MWGPQPDLESGAFDQDEFAASSIRRKLAASSASFQTTREPLHDGPISVKA